jgi:HNH endonuclease
MNTAKKLLIEYDQNDIPLPKQVLKMLSRRTVPDWLREQVLKDPGNPLYTVRMVRNLINKNKVPPKYKIKEQVIVGKCIYGDCPNKHHKDGWCIDHWNAFNNQKSGAHRLSKHRELATKALGRPLPPLIEVHHIDGNENNNDPSNLVICPNHAYHMLLERRGRAYRACGHADWLKCKFCKKYDNPKNLHIPKARKGNIRRYTWAYHSRCYEKKYSNY